MSLRNSDSIPGYHGFVPGNEHGHPSLVFLILFAEPCCKVPLFKQRSDDDPAGPEHVEQKPIGCYIGGRPEDDEDAEVQWVPDPPVRTTNNEGRKGRRRSPEVGLDRTKAQKIK